MPFEGINKLWECQKLYKKNNYNLNQTSLFLLTFPQTQLIYWTLGIAVRAPKNFSVPFCCAPLHEWSGNVAVPLIQMFTNHRPMVFDYVTSTHDADRNLFRVMAAQRDTTCITLLYKLQSCLSKAIMYCFIFFSFKRISTTTYLLTKKF